MGVTDPVADFLNHLLNSSKVRKPFALTPYSTFKEEICKILKREGFIQDFSVIQEDKDKRKILVTLRYGEDKTPAITGFKKVSRPGLLVFVKKHRIPRVLNGYGIAIISTSKGLLTDEECRKMGVGGQVICYIW